MFSDGLLVVLRFDAPYGSLFDKKEFLVQGCLEAVVVHMDILGNEATATEEGAKLTDAYIILPSNLFAALDDDAEKLAVEITFSKQNSTWPGSQWSERLFNFTDDFDVEDGVQNGTNGLGLTYNGTFGTTKAPYQPGAYMEGALTGTYEIPLDKIVTVKAEPDFTTNTATLYLDGVKVKSGVSTDKITVSDLKKFTYNTIGRSYDMWSMYGFMTVANFKISYAKTEKNVCKSLLTSDIRNDTIILSGVIS